MKTMKPAGTQSDKGLKFDGAEAMAPQKSSTKFAHNKFTGHSNDGRLVQMGQQPNRKGNDGSCSHSGMAQGGKMPPTSALPAVPAQGSVRDNINRGSQHRGQGGMMARSPANPDRQNAGRGPTKGNQQ
jgi:hypothetical protein